MIRIVINLIVEGFHCWPQCPFEDVAFLVYPHRHLFKIRCEKNVPFEDRAIEIILFKRKVESFISSRFGTPADFGSMSCESIAKIIFEQFALYSCEVLEDGENGAIVTK